MKFDTPATANPIDQLKVVGQPVNRIDGLLKTTGTAPYAYERHDVAPNAAYGFVVGAAIARGRIRSIDLAEARRAPGVLAIVTAQSAGQLGQGKMNTAPLLAGPQVDHYHQAVALVVAETFEQARAAHAVAFVAHFFVVGAIDAAAAAVDRALDVVFRHIGVSRLVDRQAQARIGDGVGTAHTGRHRDLLDQARPDFAALGIGGSLFMLDIGPFAMSCHVESSLD